MLKQYQYDQDKNLTGLFVQSGNAILANNRYLYDGNGNRTRKQQLGGETLYHYDPLNQLQKVQYPGYTEELFYDKAGNRTKRIAQGVEELYQYDPRNRLTAYTKNGATTLFRYDHAGNLLSDDKARYSYDAFNRTIQVETFDGNIQVNRYDAESLRHEMEENGSLVQFIFNQDREVIAEQNSLGITRYIRSSELIARNTDAARTYYHYVSDEIGSTTHIVDEDGIVLNHYDYDAWGNLTAQEEAVPNRFKFTGQQLDSVTQQYYLRARFYNPVIARFTQEDTYRGDGLNLYAYCANRPTYYIDPTGHWCDTKQDAFNKLASERGLDPDKMDYDTKQRLMAEASNIVKEQKKNPYAAAQNATLALPENTSAINQSYNPSAGVKKPRYQSGTVTGADKLPNVQTMMRGTHGNIGVIPKEVGEKLQGKTFNDFDEFRHAFWTEIGNSKYANEFSASNRSLMQAGKAPFTALEQTNGQHSKYVIHHLTPIHVGGNVYDLSNMIISTPRMHVDILDRNYHFNINS